MPNAKRIAVVAKECVACGCCVNGCPKKAIAIHKGIRAVVNDHSCVGCGKCAKACPAGVIQVQEVEDCEEAVV